MRVILSQLVIDAWLELHGIGRHLKHSCHISLILHGSNDPVMPSCALPMSL